MAGARERNSARLGRKAAELEPARVRKLEPLVANGFQDSDSASESGRRAGDVGSEACEVGLVAAASGCLWYQSQRWP